jgi:hypothetical protein
MVKLAGVAVVLGAAYAAYHYLFGHGWLATSTCLIIWFFLASLYKPGPVQHIPLGGSGDPWTENEKQILFGKDYKRKLQATGKE